MTTPDFTPGNLPQAGVEPLISQLSFCARMAERGDFKPTLEQSARLRWLMSAIDVALPDHPTKLEKTHD